MKIKPRYGFGGFLDSLDSQLDKLGSFGRFIVEATEPTGLTAWKPTEKALEAFMKDSTIGTGANLLFNAWAAVPAFGVLRSLPRLASLLFTKASRKGEAKLVRKIEDLPKVIDVDTYKKIIDPKTDCSELLAKLNFEDLKKLQSCVETSATKFAESMGDTVKTPEQVAKLQKYEQLLKDLDKNINRTLEEAKVTRTANGSESNYGWNQVV